MPGGIVFPAQSGGFVPLAPAAVVPEGLITGSQKTTINPYHRHRSKRASKQTNAFVL